MANPFTKEDKAKMDMVLKSITEIKKDILKAKVAGIDVAETEKKLLESEQRLQLIKRTYFPA